MIRSIHTIKPRRILTLFAFVFSFVLNAQDEKRILLRVSAGYSGDTRHNGIAEGLGLMVQKKIHTYHLLFDRGVDINNSDLYNRYASMGIAAIYGPGFNNDKFSAGIGTGIGFIRTRTPLDNSYWYYNYYYYNNRNYNNSTTYSYPAIPLNAYLALHSKRVGFFVQSTNYFSAHQKFNFRVLAGLEFKLNK